jgi:SAM-dependent methyltransferase
MELSVTVITLSHGWMMLRLGEVWEYRTLLYFLTWRDIRVGSEPTVFGVAWAIMQPFGFAVEYAMDISLHWLRCPFCGGSFSASRGDQHVGESDYDVLTCYCSHYPVVAGIPILKKDPTGILDTVLALIEAGRHREALLALISPTNSALAPAWIRSLPSARWNRWLKHLMHQRALRHWQEQAAALLTEQDGRVTACALFDFCFPNRNTYNYFAFRFGQPRHLVALSFISIIHQTKKPILDLACGVGHLTYHLVQRAQGQPVIGVDDLFFGLYMAKHWVAPEATYICCAADTALPFPDGAFSVAFCSDAFHYFLSKTTSMRELERLTQDDGLIMLVSIRNMLVQNRHGGLQLPPEGYQALVADMPYRCVANSAVLGRYLQKQGPPLARSAGLGSLAHEPLLSIVASHEPEVFQDYGPFTNWPHAEGYLSVNPLYEVERRDGFGKVCLRRMFPSALYEEENAECKEYLPEIVEIQSEILADLAQGKRTVGVEKLIEQYVVLGMPEQYR